MHSSNFLIPLVAILQFPHYFFSFVRLQCHHLSVFSVFYHQILLEDYYVEKSTHISFFFQKMLHFQFLQRYDFKNIFLFCYLQDNDSFEVKRTSVKNPSVMVIFTELFLLHIPHSVMFIWIWVLFYEIIMPAHFKEGVHEESKSLEVFSGSTLASFLLQ